MNNATDNVIVLAAQFASQLHCDDVTNEFLESYRKSRRFYQNHVVTEILASMVYVTMDDNRNALRHMRNAKRLSNDDNNANYRLEVERLYRFLIQEHLNLRRNRMGLV